MPLIFPSQIASHPINIDINSDDSMPPDNGLMVNSPHICVIGSLNIDFVTSAPRHPGPGETLTATSRKVTAGGKGANQAVACSKAGFLTKFHHDVSVSMIGAVGEKDTLYATLLKPELEKSGVIIGNVREVPGQETGSATILIDESADGENRILMVPGANYSGMNDVDAICAVLKRYYYQPQVVILQGEIPRETVLGLLQYLNDSKLSTHAVFNAAPVFPKGIPVSALTGLAVLVVNETEAMQLARLVAEEVSINFSKEGRLEPMQLTNLFHREAKVKIVLITFGSKGTYYSTETGCSGFVPAVSVSNVVDTTAAGDTFVGYFSHAFAKFVALGKDISEFDGIIKDVVTIANGAAAICVQRKGAMQSVPFAYECI